MEACKFYTPSNTHFSMHNNLREADGHPFLDTLPFESCCNSEVMKASGTKLAACGYTTDNRECNHFQSDRKFIVGMSLTDPSKQHRIIIAETRSRFGFVLREIYDMTQIGEDFSFNLLHSIHAGIFETEEEFISFSEELKNFELESRSMRNTNLLYASKAMKNQMETVLNGSENDESLMKKVFSHA